MLEIKHVVRRYGSVAALDGISLDIRSRELITFLGPSGCGKTTLLRVIAGFVCPDSGDVLLDGRDITRVQPHHRPVNMVFQRPTLFPHLDVFENVAFGLRIARVPRPEVKQRVADALALVRLEGFERRRAHELSGGQMQRIALARALVNRPRVLLLDEPLSALDLRIRLEMEEELRRVHRETGATFVYVTHDQREALGLSDRVVVLNGGKIEQVGTPDEIYRRPRSPFTARFVGDANVLPVVVVGSGTQASVRLASFSVQIVDGGNVGTGEAWLVVRPEAVRLSPVTEGAIRGTVRDVAFRGSAFTYRLELPGVDELLKSEQAADVGSPHALGSEVGVHWDPSACIMLRRDPSK